MKTILIVNLLVILAILTIGYAAGLIYLISKGRVFIKLYHDILEWHIPNTEPIKFDDCSIHACCKICGKDIMQDSQGNWF